MCAGIQAISLGRGLVVMVVLISTVACERSTESAPGLGRERIAKPTVEKLGELAVAALVENDEAAFVSLHVQEGDMTPNREFMIAAGAGKPLPDVAWNTQVREAFKRARADLERVTVGLGGLSFAGIRDVETQDEGERGGRFYKLRVNVRKQDKAFILSFMNGMESQRGWVFVDDPVVVIEAM